MLYLLDFCSNTIQLDPTPNSTYPYLTEIVYKNNDTISCIVDNVDLSTKAIKVYNLTNTNQQCSIDDLHTLINDWYTHYHYMYPLSIYVSKNDITSLFANMYTVITLTSIKLIKGITPIYPMLTTEKIRRKSKKSIKL